MFTKKRICLLLEVFEGRVTLTQMYCKKVSSGPSEFHFFHIVILKIGILYLLYTTFMHHVLFQIAVKIISIRCFKPLSNFILNLTVFRDRRGFLTI